MRSATWRRKGTSGRGGFVHLRRPFARGSNRRGNSSGWMCLSASGGRSKTISCAVGSPVMVSLSHQVNRSDEYEFAKRPCQVSTSSSSLVIEVECFNMVGIHEADELGADA